MKMPLTYTSLLFDVKPPERPRATISHFTPADHNFRAIGSVVINRESKLRNDIAQNTVFSPKKINSNSEVRFSLNSESKVIKDDKVPTNTLQNNKQDGSKLLRKVTVKTPVKQTGTISHFASADHRFDATGTVNIEGQTSEAQNIQTDSNAVLPLAIEPVPVPVLLVSLPKVDAQNAVSASAKPESSVKRQKTTFSRTVSVNTPKKPSSVISHFTPAGHRFVATGSVLVNQENKSSSESQSFQKQEHFTKEKSQLSFESKSNVAKAIISPKLETAQRQISIAPTVLKTANNQVPLQRIKSNSAKSSFTRTISINTPEKQPGVISHFTPASHNFLATGSVTINQGSASSVGTSNVQHISTSRGAQRLEISEPQLHQSAPEEDTNSKQAQITEVEIKNPSSRTNEFSQKSKNSPFSRTINIKTQERPSKVISHFTPATHKFDATGSVAINRDATSKLRSTADTQKQIQSIEKKSVSSSNLAGASSFATVPISVVEIPPLTRQGVINSNIKKDSNAQFNSNTRKINSDKNIQDLSLTRTVTINTPEQKLGVISHFIPASHKFAATGTVSINQGSSSESKNIGSQQKLASLKTETIKKKSDLPTIPVNVPKILAVQVSGASQLNLQETVNNSEVKKVTSESVDANKNTENLSLRRTVSIKTPEKHSGVISHFTPATHRFDARGHVTINQKISTNAKHLNTGRQTESLRTKAVASSQRSVSSDSSVKLIPVQELPVNDHERTNKFVQSSSSTKNDPSSKRLQNISFSRTVSVNTPSQQSRVIAHFTPAAHKFDATGSVTINQASSSLSNNINTLQNTESLKAEHVNKQSALPTVLVSIPKIPVVQPSASLRSSTQVVSRSNEARKVVKNSALINNNADDLSLSRTVSIKTPERPSGVISHFTPATHRFDASGHVTINQKISTNAKTLDTERQPPVLSREKQLTSSQLSTSSTSVVRPVQVQEFILNNREKINAAVPSNSVSRNNLASKNSQNLSLTRTVNVQTPRQQSGVIAHFTPAVHRFDATGSVTINQGASSASKTLESRHKTISLNAERVNEQGVLSTTSVNIPKIPAVQSSTTSQSTIQAALRSSNVKKITSERIRANNNSEGLSLSRTISIKTPERPSSAISHFTPAAHRFDATGSVIIDSNPTSATITEQKTLSSTNVRNLNQQKNSQENVSVFISHIPSTTQQPVLIAEEQIVQTERPIINNLNTVNVVTNVAAKSSVSKHKTLSSTEINKKSEEIKQSSHNWERAKSISSQRSSGPSSSKLLEELIEFRNIVPEQRTSRLSTNIDANAEQIGSYTFGIDVADDQSTNYQSRYETVGKDGVVQGWYTVLLPDGFLYNYTYMSGPGMGYMVMVNRVDSGITMKPIESNIYEPAHRFSNTGLSRLSDFAVRTNNEYVDYPSVEGDQNGAFKFSRSLLEALKVQKSSSSSSGVSQSVSSPIKLSPAIPEIPAASNQYVSETIVRAPSPVAVQQSPKSPSQPPTYLPTASQGYLPVPSQVRNTQVTASTTSHDSTSTRDQKRGFEDTRTVQVEPPRQSAGPHPFFVPVQHNYRARGTVSIKRDRS